MRNGGLRHAPLKFEIMEDKCFFCDQTMVETNSRTEVKNGVARQLTELKCTNPECENVKVLDRPY